MCRYLVVILFFMHTLYANHPIETVKVGVHSNFPPHYSLDKKGHPQGFAIDMIEALMQRMNKKIEYHVFNQWEDAHVAIQQGTIDLLPNLEVFEERKNIYFFTDPIEISEIGVYTLKEANYTTLEDLHGRRIGVVKSDVGVTLVDHIVNASSHVFADSETMMRALLAEKIDGFIYPRSVTHVLLYRLKIDDKIVPLGPPLMTVKRSIGVGHHHFKLYQALHEELQNFLKTAEFSRIYHKWHGEDPLHFWEYWEFKLLVAFFVALLGSLLAYHYWVLRQSERQLKREAKAMLQELQEKIIQKEKAEANLRRNEQWFKHLFEKAPIAYCMLDGNGLIQNANEKWVRVMGYDTASEVLGTGFEVFMDRKNQQAFQAFLGTLKQEGKVDRAELEVLKKEGQKIIIGVSGSLHTDEKNREFIHCIFANITQIKHHEEMLLAQSRVTAMGEMVGMIAHQWRQPLATLNMQINNLLADIELETFCEEELEQELQKMSKCIIGLSETIDDFRDFFKPDKAKIMISLDSVLETTLTIVSKSIENNGITLEKEGSLPDVYPLYAKSLSQVFINILNNAKDVLVAKRPKTPKISIRLEETDQFLIVHICDNGGGIPADILPHIFEPYVSTKSENGTGLGLFMCKTIIEKHSEGQLRCHNGEAGACFTMTLPKGQ